MYPNVIGAERQESTNEAHVLVGIVEYQRDRFLALLDIGGGGLLELLQ